MLDGFKDVKLGQLRKGDHFVVLDRVYEVIYSVPSTGDFHILSAGDPATGGFIDGRFDRNTKVLAKLG